MLQYSHSLNLIIIYLRNLLKYMKISYSISDVNELLTTIGKQSNAAISSMQNEEIIKFPSRICDGWMQRVSLRSGIELITQSLEFSENTIIEAEYKQRCLAFGLSFCLSGSARGRMTGIKEDLIYTSDQGSLGFALDHKGSLEYAVGERINFVHIVMEPGNFRSFIDEEYHRIPTQLQQIIEGADTSLYIDNYIITPAMRMAAQQILNCPYQGLTKRLFLESKAIELIAYYINELTQKSEENQKNYTKLKDDDIARVQVAKQILLNNYQNPPSLLNLAKSVGLNDYKLKIGFRQCFNTTVFGCLHDYRMQQATELLKINTLNVTEVARAVGYTSETSFSAAFRKKFGIPPSIYKACN